VTDEGKTPETKPRLFTLPWFKPLYRRVILIAIVAAWCVFEWFFNHEQLWQWITLAALAYAIWSFGINFDKELKKYEDGQPKS
jgi:hypothetical protein